MLWTRLRPFTWTVLIFSFIRSPATAQDIKLTAGTHGTQWGVAAKFTLETDHGWHPIIRLALSGGVGTFIGGSNFFPSLHADIMFYNNGFGSPKNEGKKPAIVPDFLLSATITKG